MAKKEYRVEYRVEESWDDSDIYSSEARESMQEDDELSLFEEAFMNGYGKT